MHKRLTTLALVAMGAIGLSTAAMAAPLDTFAGTVSFSDTSPLFNNPVFFTGTFANPSFNFAPTALGQSMTDKLTVTATDSDLFNQTFNDNVAVSLAFTLPNATNASIGGNGSLTDTFIFIGYFDDGTLTFNAPTSISFTDGSVLTAAMDNISLTGFDGVAGGSGNLTLTLSKVPEPTTLALFGMGLLGLGFLARRRKLV